MEYILTIPPTGIVNLVVKISKGIN
jgi:hypothetical protein